MMYSGSLKGGLPPSASIIGWLIYRPDTDEFFHSHRSGKGYCGYAYVKQPALAYFFDSERTAYRFSKHIDRITEIVPLYDIGHQLAVAFPSDQSAGFPCQG